ncbi:response regulator receiver modulated diguanylate phosphodiesterase [Bradyrhizobium sp. R2.2-H]|uniref:EAL domain-containing response regulator n=1 Tax=unclassified Bradyrhizobium TaxID=2631580 RepID=UPI0010F1A526|nr:MULTISPECIES: EAL domain-containing response regulator [unclassified Bradyrhizobium]TCU66154.1 response regulator receiver modulated diguanylate phosphodiesterase [Bradyrhizobium sp. Y-H1]TCU67905.1 response regulator receiver modulated diguanylate phosphodiesterase [Bradyrhizobium sp. R2.2-H]
MSATRGRLLVVDDDLVQRVLISKIGSKLGYDSVVVPSYEAATELLARETFDIMALDLSLGERDGVELLRFVAERDLRAMSIVIISGCDDRIMKATRRVAVGLKLPLAGCLTKPLDLNRLRCALELPQRSPLVAKTASPPPRITPDRIARGLANREFFVEFQPKVALRTGRVVGAEALARWRTAEFGMVSPMVFIPIAEQAGLMREVTDCILSSALSQGRKMIERNPGFTIAVNISGSLMSDLTLPDRIEEILRRENVPPSSLTVEITETTAMADVDRANDILVRLRLKNIGTAIDDFGTGYSSLAVLARLPFSELKIDQSFIKGCESDDDMMKIVDASVALAKAFNMKVVAEGVENSEALDIIRRVGCDVAQGFYFAPSLRRSRAERWISERNSLADEQAASATPAALAS